MSKYVSLTYKVYVTDAKIKIENKRSSHLHIVNFGNRTTIAEPCVWTCQLTSEGRTLYFVIRRLYKFVCMYKYIRSYAKFVCKLDLFLT